MHAARIPRLSDLRPSNRSASWFRPSVLAALLGIAGIFPATAVPLAVPALVTPVSQEHHVGKVVFVELVTPDMAAAKKFYGGLFGWTFSDTQKDGMDYSEASLDGHSVAGLVQRKMGTSEHRRPAWLSFIAVRDVDATNKTALEHGAKQLYSPHNLPDRGREAVYADPQGAVFAVLASSSGDPEDVLASPGEWIWSSLITTDADTAAAFYQELFDYEIFEMPAKPGMQHLMLASDNYARASANSLASVKSNTPPHWLNYVRVGDTVAMTLKVIELGGKVLVEPRVDRHGGKVAVVSDASGATFGLMEWPDNESKEASK